jgi:hypothetical protein
MGVEVILTQALNDAGNIGVFCSTSGENRYEAATVATHRWTLTSTSGTCFIYSWNGSKYRAGLTGAGTYATTVPVEPPPGAASGGLSFAGVPDSRPTMANRLTGLYTPAAGSTVTIVLSQALSDAGNIGVYCVTSRENHYGAATVGSRTYTIANPSGGCFVYSWTNATFRAWLTGAGTYSYAAPVPTPTPTPAPTATPTPTPTPTATPTATPVPTPTPVPTATPVPGSVPVIGAAWAGEYQGDLTPPDPTGAMGPSSYIELTNLRYQVAGRDGTVLGSGDLGSLTGLPVYELSDPQVIWDPSSQRFFYVVLDVYRFGFAFGFSKTADPRSPSDFCQYILNYGYGSTFTLPDYPKLAVTNDFVLIGSNDFRFMTTYTGSNVDWLYKPPPGPCPGSLAGGQFQQLRAGDGSLAATPNPVVNTDPSDVGWVVANQDVGTGSGTYLSLFRITKGSTGAPILDPAITIPVASYSVPASAPQPGTAATLDTMDARLRHAVAGVDPLLGGLAIWTSHAVFGGAGSEERWYEISGGATPALVQSGSVTSANLYVFNGGISPDRASDGTTGSYGSNMVIGFNTASTTEFPALQMASKRGAAGQSPWVLVKQSPAANEDDSCTPTCRWGDYSGASPDPLASAGGQVWLSGEWNIAGATITDKDWRTWNWGATP